MGSAVVCITKIGVSIDLENAQVGKLFIMRFDDRRRNRTKSFRQADHLVIGITPIAS